MNNLTKMFTFYKNKIFWHIFVYSTVIFIIDHIIKNIILFRFLNNQKPIALLPFFSIDFIYNYGISFSILNSINPILIVMLSVIALIIIIFFIIKSFDIKDELIQVSIGFIIGGALGNIYDRVRIGAVIDFMHFYIGKYSFPVFNFADIFISFAAVILFYKMFFNSNKSNNT